MTRNKVIHKETLWLGVFLAVTATAGATEEVSPNPNAMPVPAQASVPNVPPELASEPVFLPPPMRPGDSSADLASMPSVEADTPQPDASQPISDPTPEPDTHEAVAPAPMRRGVPIGKPAQRAIVESHAWAENPAAMPVRDAEGRVVFAFNESAPTVVCSPTFLCDVQLQPGEVVQGAPHIGDAVRWKVAPAVSGSGEHRVTHLIVKPTEVGLDTNVIIPTDRRTYHLRLVSSSAHYVSSIAFDYPEEEHQDAWQSLTKSSLRNDSSVSTGEMPTVAVDRLNFNYKIKVVKGKPTFKPLRAMDDGYHTYISMNEDMPQREAPVLIGISPTGDEQMINYRLKGNLYVVDGTQFKLALVSGVGRKQERIELTRDACHTRGTFGICRDAKE